MQLKFKNSQFKIMQVADTQEGKNVSPDTLALINSAIEKEQPDLIGFQEATDSTKAFLRANLPSCYTLLGCAD